MQIYQKSFCHFLLKFKTCEVSINPTANVKEGIVVYSVTDTPYLKYDLDGVTIVIDKAGEYESKEIFVIGEKVKELPNVCYMITGDSINVGVIGFINDIKQIPYDLYESCDVLLLNAGGGMFLTPKMAHEVIQKITPKICIVYGFSEQANKDLQATLIPLSEFITEVPAANEYAEKSFKIIQDDLGSSDDTIIYYFKN